MDKETLKQFCILLYQEFYRTVNLNSSYNFKPLPRDLTMLDKFIDGINEEYNLPSIGCEFVINFTEFQFNRWYRRDDEESILKFGNKSIMFNMIFGSKAFEYYEQNKTIDYKKRRFFRKVNKSINDGLIKKCRKIYQDLVGETKQNTLSITEEGQKSKFHNLEEGLEWCIMNTTLYNHLSEYCVKCFNCGNCKDILRGNYPNTYKKRGYGE